MSDASPVKRGQGPAITVFRDRSRLQNFHLVMGVFFIIQGLATAAWFTFGDHGLDETWVLVAAVGCSLFLAWVGLWFASQAFRRLRDPENPIVIGPAGLHDRAISARPIPWQDIRNMHLWTGKGGPVVGFDLSDGAAERAGVHPRVRFSVKFNRPFGYDYRIHSMGTDADIDQLVAAITPYAEVRPY
jgi:hypothetical protein